MAVLSNADRLAIWAQWMSDNHDPVTGAMTKTEFRAAVDAADQWANDNAAAYNTALPQPARGALSSSQKAELLSLIIERRWKVGA